MERRDPWLSGVSRREFLERTIEIGAGLAALGACAQRRGAGREPSPLGALEARYASSGSELSLSNDAIAASWSVADGVLHSLRVRDVRGGRELALPAPVFSLMLADGGTLSSDGLKITRGPTPESIPARRDASRLSDRQAGRQVTVVLEDDAHRLRATWRAVLRDGSPYMRQEVLLTALGDPLPVREISLIDLSAPGAVVSGTVK
jgi:hypothetical protein